MILLIHLLLIFKTFRTINLKCLAIQGLIGIFYYLIFNFGYYNIYGCNNFNSNTLIDLGITTLGSGVFKGSVEMWSKRYYLHHIYPESSLDPNKNYLMNFKSLKNTDIIRNYNRVGFTGNKIINFQHKNYKILSLTFGFLLPVSICYLLTNDFKGSFSSCFQRIILLWHITNFKNNFLKSSISLICQRKKINFLEPL